MPSQPTLRQPDGWQLSQLSSWQPREAALSPACLQARSVAMLDAIIAALFLLWLLGWLVGGLGLGGLIHALLGLVLILLVARLAAALRSRS